MKLLFIIFIFTSLQAFPEWYLQIQPKNSYEIIGFGEGKTIQEAKLFAKDDIAKKIQSSVSSYSEKDTKLNNDNLNKSFSSKIIEKSNVNLQDIKFVKNEKYDGIFYIALSYENLPFEKRFAKNVKKTKCGDEKQNPYLASTYLFKKLNKAVGCKLDIKLLRKDSMWYLTYKDYMQVVPTSIFEDLFSSQTNKNFIFTPSSARLVEGDEFYFDFKSKKNGYINLLSIYEDGTVSVLLQNKKISKNKKIQIPNKNYEYIFEAGLIKKDVASYEVFLLIYTPNKLDLSRFSNADNKLTTGESNKKFDELISFIRNKEFISVLLRTIPKL